MYARSQTTANVLTRMRSQRIRAIHPSAFACAPAHRVTQSTRQAPRQRLQPAPPVPPRLPPPPPTHPPARARARKSTRARGAQQAIQEKLRLSLPISIRDGEGEKKLRLAHLVFLISFWLPKKKTPSPPSCAFAISVSHIVSNIYIYIYYNIPRPARPTCSRPGPAQSIHSLGPKIENRLRACVRACVRARARACVCVRARLPSPGKGCPGGSCPPQHTEKRGDRGGERGRPGAEDKEERRGERQAERKERGGGGGREPPARAPPTAAAGAPAPAPGR